MKSAPQTNLLVVADADYVWAAIFNHITPANTITIMTALLPNLL